MVYGLPLRRFIGATLVHGYVRWHHLRRLRRRPEGRPITTEHTGRIRGEVHAAVHLLNWLNECGSCLSECTHSDIDLWAAEKPLGASRLAAS
jgi:uncharacterized membrane protein